MIKNILGKFIFPIAIIAGLAGLGMCIAAMVMSLDGYSIWDMVSSPATGSSKVNAAINMGTYGAIGGAVIAGITLMLGFSLYKEEFVTHKVRFSVIILAYIFAAIAIVFSAIVLDEAINATNATWLFEHGVVIGQ